MRSRSGTAALVASPVLVGAVTVLIAIIAVLIAYGANQGLPFVPTYDVKAELPSGAKLVKGNEVRTGGFRVGVVSDIKPTTTRVDGESKTVALATLKLDKTVEPLATDTKLRVRPRSALGLKYVELTPGRARRAYKAGDTIPVESASEPLEFEDVYEIFDRETRPAVQRATAGFGDSFAGRGQSINESVDFDTATLVANELGIETRPVEEAPEPTEEETPEPISTKQVSRTSAARHGAPDRPTSVRGPPPARDASGATVPASPSSR